MSPPTTPSRARGLRLQKALAEAGIGARRDCEALIVEGRVRVNGRVCDTLPAFIDPAKDLIEIDGEQVDLSAVVPGEARSRKHALTYVLLNKPKGVITTTHDPGGRRNVLELLPLALRRDERLYPVGRLDADSTGLLLLTNDGDLAYQLTHPKFGVPKEYHVLCTGLAGEEQLARLRAGMYLVTPEPGGNKSSKRAAVESVRILKRHVDRARGDRTLLSIRLREGQNREIRRMLARVGLKVRELERVAIGPLRNPGLKPGESKLLGRKAVEQLRSAALGSE